MPNPAPIILILGAGPNIGQSIARIFAAKGFRIALASRRANEAFNTSDQIYIPSDFSEPNAIINVFTKVKSSLGIPSVVVYNGKTYSPS